tara:strand:+ start:978 stop:1181 length:204 start_codon:yes stop_codon:yes gene_type:complete
MFTPSSPYVVFKASNWEKIPPSPIGLGNCVRVSVKKKIKQKNFLNSTKKGKISKDFPSQESVQLSFA